MENKFPIKRKTAIICAKCGQNLILQVMNEDWNELYCNTCKERQATIHKTYELRWIHHGIKGHTLPIPYEACDKCIEILSIIQDEENGMKRYIEFEKKNNPQYLNIPDIDSHLGLQYHEFRFTVKRDQNKCPFKLKPDLSGKERRKYKLKCMSCKTKFTCPEEVFRHQRKALCGECLADNHDPFEGCPDPTHEDDQHMIDEHLREKYGEC